MPGGGPVSAGQGPQQYAFMATGPTQQAALAASSITLTLAQFVSTAPYAPQCQFWNLGSGVANSIAFVVFGTSVTVSSTVGVPIVPLSLMGAQGEGADQGMQILTTGKTPVNVITIGSAGTTTVFVTPGEGSR